MSGSWATPRGFVSSWTDTSKATPELFPPGIDRGYRMKDVYTSRKTGCKLRRIELRDLQLLPGPALLSDALPVTAVPRTCRPPFSPQVRRPLLGVDRGLRAFPVRTGTAWSVPWDGPAWWERPYRRRSGCPATWSPTRSTRLWAGVSKKGLPGDHRRWRAPPGPGPGEDGRGGRPDGRLRRVPGGGPPPRPEVPTGDGQHRRLARHPGGLADALQGRHAILCFLHAFLKIRDRAVHMKETFSELSCRVWEADHAPDARSFSQRLRRLRAWSEARRWTSRSCRRRCGRCATSGRRSCGRMPTPAAIARATRWTDCYGGSTTTCTVASTCTARRRLLNWDCVVGH